MLYSSLLDVLYCIRYLRTKRPQLHKSKMNSPIIYRFKSTPLCSLCIKTTTHGQETTVLGRRLRMYIHNSIGKRKLCSINSAMQCDQVIFCPPVLFGGLHLFVHILTFQVFPLSVSSFLGVSCHYVYSHCTLKIITNF